MRRKFRNIPVEVDGHKFPSKAEARRYGELKLLERAGQVHNMKLQERFPLYVNQTLLGHYVADFTYSTHKEQLICEDVKGGNATKTPIYRWKAKHMAAQYGIVIREVA